MSAVDPAPFEAFRFCPACASRECGADSRKRFLCRACGFRYYQNAACAVIGVLFDEAWRLLVAVRSREPGKGMLDLPGGFVDPGETAEEALRREVSEETGIVVGATEYHTSFTNRYRYAGVLYETTDLVFSAHVHAGDAGAGHEVTELRFVPAACLLQEEFAFESARRAVDVARSLHAAALQP